MARTAPAGDNARGPGRHERLSGRERQDGDGALLRAVGLSGRLAGPVDFALQGGECLAITGRSGAGKTLLLRMVADLDPHHGEAWLHGVACSAMPAPAWRQRVLYVAAESGWWAPAVSAHFTAPPGAEMLARFGLRADILAASVAACSTGERQRLALLRALALAPAVLLLDEPTGALDRESVAQVEAVLQEYLAVGGAMLLVTHDPGQAERLGSRQCRLQDGVLRPA
jgi:putative ABC transport system ATP-binding protein